MKHTPATPLPWAQNQVDPRCIMGKRNDRPDVEWSQVAASQPRQAMHAHEAIADAAYIAHAANAYPRLVAELKRLCVEIPRMLGSNQTMKNDLLRELGEEQ